jgi:hypothetical protein
VVSPGVNLTTQLPSVVEVKNDGICTSTPLCLFMANTGDTVSSALLRQFFLKSFYVR